MTPVTPAAIPRPNLRLEGEEPWWLTVALIASGFGYSATAHAVAWCLVR